MEIRLHLTANPVVRLLSERVERVLADGILDPEEAADLLTTLSAFAGGDFEDGELIKATTLPLCNPAPSMKFPGSLICFTGTFAFGSRRTCEAAAQSKGAIPGSLTGRTHYLVIGAYAPESWAQSAFGRKIEKAVEMRSGGKPIQIVSEAHWTDQMNIC